MLQDSSQIFNNKIQALTQQLQQQQALNRLWLNQDFQVYLLPLLSQENKWLDPQDFKSEQEFQRAYNVMWARAKVAKEIIDLLKGAEQRMQETAKIVERENVRNKVTTTKSSR